MEHRAFERQPAHFKAQCASLGRFSEARLLDISQHGCRVELTDAILARGNPVRLRIPGVSSLDGRVIWDDGGCAGVSFAMPLHPAVVDYIAGRLSDETAERLGVATAAVAR